LFYLVHSLLFKISCILTLKRPWQEIFNLCFFHQKTSPRPLISIETFLNVWLRIYSTTISQVLWKLISIQFKNFPKPFRVHIHYNIIPVFLGSFLIYNIQYLDSKKRKRRTQLSKPNICE
jgi:hypothetical protein